MCRVFTHQAGEGRWGGLEGGGIGVAAGGVGGWGSVGVGVGSGGGASPLPVSAFSLPLFLLLSNPPTKYPPLPVSRPPLPCPLPMTCLPRDISRVGFMARQLSFETGKVGRQASGAVMASDGDTVVYSTACTDKVMFMNCFGILLRGKVRRKI